MEDLSLLARLQNYRSAIILMIEHGARTGSLIVRKSEAMADSVMLELFQIFLRKCGSMLTEEEIAVVDFLESVT